MSKNRGSAIIDYENGIILIKRIKGYGQNKKIYYTGVKIEFGHESVENVI